MSIGFLTQVSGEMLGVEGRRYIIALRSPQVAAVGDEPVNCAEGRAEKEESTDLWPHRRRAFCLERKGVGQR